MKKTFDSDNIFGKWKVKVTTPFGPEDYILSIDSLITQNNICGSVSDQKNIMNFNNGKLDDNSFSCSFDTDFPIKSTVYIQIDQVENEKISGSVKIDNYLFTLFSGEK